jgi:hypothetical protein
MKKHYLVFLLLLTACQKEQPVTKPVHFTSTTYEFLGSYDNTSKPNYLVSRDVVSDGMLNFIKTTLPEGSDVRKTHPELLTTKAIADISLTQASDIYVTFVSQGANLADAFAFYTYPTNAPPSSAKDIQKITYVFPNAGHLSPLWAGDKVKIGSFNPGTSIGFVLMQDAWKDSTKTLNNDAVHFCSNDVLNPETDPSLKKHAVMISYSSDGDRKVLVGFEDIDRTKQECDNDFNDVVVYATVTPH